MKLIFNSPSSNCIRCDINCHAQKCLYPSVGCAVKLNPGLTVIGCFVGNLVGLFVGCFVGPENLVLATAAIFLVVLPKIPCFFVGNFFGVAERHDCPG